VMGVDRCDQRCPAAAGLSVTQLTHQTLACQQSRPHQRTVAGRVRQAAVAGPACRGHASGRAVTSPQDKASPARRHSAFASPSAAHIDAESPDQRDAGTLDRRRADQVALRVEVDRI
jgi:hypothetical protein